MKRHLAIATFLLTTLAASTAWACPTGDFGVVFGSIVAGFLAIPYAVMTSMVILSQATEWFGERRLGGWFLASLGGTLVGWIGSGVGLALAEATDTLAFNDALPIVVILSTPLVCEVAYMMWLHSRRPDQLLDDSGI